MTCLHNEVADDSLSVASWMRSEKAPTPSAEEAEHLHDSAHQPHPLTDTFVLRDTNNYSPMFVYYMYIMFIMLCGIDKKIDKIFTK